MMLNDVRHLLLAGLMPVMEIVFVLQKTRVVENELIEFETVWGMPMNGEGASERPARVHCCNTTCSGRRACTPRPAHA